MKKLPFLFLFILCFCTCVCAGSVFPVSDFAEAFESEGKTYNIKFATTSGKTEEEIGDSIGLVEYVDLFYKDESVNHQKDIIVLQSNINMAGIELSSTIGNYDKPFEGTFVGNGFSISNLTVQAKASSNNANYVGLIGYAKNAKISGLGFGGNVVLKSTLGALTTYAGALAGKTENCNISNIQMSGKVFLESQFNENVNFGGMIGMAQDCDVAYVICKLTEFGKLNFEGKDNKIHSVGACIGRQYNTTLVFGVVQANIEATFAQDFEGQVYVGGVCGAVAEGGSKIINVAVENNFVVDENDGLLVGEVAGIVLNPTPACSGNDRNLSYIHFKQNSKVSVFGNAGDYNYENAVIEESGSLLLSSISQNDLSYFSKQTWHPLLGAWNFRKVWWVNGSQISLQNFIENFSIRVSNSNAEILKGTVETNAFKYGQEAVLEFKFVDNMSKFYSATTLNLKGAEVAKIFARQIGDETVYSLSGSEDYAISSIEDGFAIVVKQVSLAVEGSYSVSTKANTFSGKIQTRLYKEDATVDETVSPGLLYYISDNNMEINPSTEPLSINRLAYSQHYKVGTRAVAGTPYAFIGWVMEKTDGTTVELGMANLDFVFGKTQNFDDDFTIYANYSVDACNITCKMDDGIAKIVFSDTIQVTTSGQVVPVSKGGQLKIKIFLEDGYDFDIDNFLAELEIFKSLTPEVRQMEEDGYHCFQLIFDLDKIDDDFLNSFTINAKTKRRTSENGSWLWWVVGGVGAVVLIGLIVLIVVLVKRRGGGYGGMGGAGKMNKKAYKNMYY